MRMHCTCVIACTLCSYLPAYLPTYLLQVWELYTVQYRPRPGWMFPGFSFIKITIVKIVLFTISQSCSQIWMGTSYVTHSVD